MWCATEKKMSDRGEETKTSGSLNFDPAEHNCEIATYKKKVGRKARRLLVAEGATALVYRGWEGARQLPYQTSPN